jgi:hypothetical protein
MKHHTLAVKLVNERISDLNFATSNGLIGALIGFACYHVRKFYSVGDLQLISLVLY